VVKSLVLLEVVITPLILMLSFVIFLMDRNLLGIMDLETLLTSQILKQFWLLSGTEFHLLPILLLLLITFVPLCGGIEMLCLLILCVNETLAQINLLNWMHCFLMCSRSSQLVHLPSRVTVYLMLGESCCSTFSFSLFSCCSFGFSHW